MFAKNVAVTSSTTVVGFAGAKAGAVAGAKVGLWCGPYAYFPPIVFGFIGGIGSVALYKLGLKKYGVKD